MLHKMEGKNKKPQIFLYTDGSSLGNPGPGGYGVVLKCGNLRKEMSAGYRLTTNNRMELMAVIAGLEAIRWERADVSVYSDSTYVVKAVTEGWLDKWVASGFKKKKNSDLWQRFIPLMRRHNLSFHWIKGHNGHPENERCDRLAVEASGRAEGMLAEDEGYIQEQQSNDIWQTTGNQ